MKKATNYLLIVLMIASLIMVSCTVMGFISAIENNDDEKIELLLEKIEKGDISEVLERDLLMYGASNGSVEIMKTLINMGADVNAYDAYLEEFSSRPPEEKYSILWIAAYKGEYEVVKLLLDAGADVNTQGLMNWTPLTMAAGSGDIEMTKLLLENGADPNVPSYDPIRIFPLYQPLFNFDTSMVKLLLKNRADPNIMDPSFGSILWHSAIGGENFKENRAWTEEETLAMLQIFLQNGADINIRDKNLLAAVDISALKGMTNVVKFFIDNGCEKDFLGANLFKKSMYEFPETIKLLLDSGVAVNGFEIHSGYTPLITLAEISLPTSLQIAKLFIEYGADVNAKSYTGLTPLTQSTYYGSKEMVGLLIENGADYNYKHVVGDFSPLMLAIACKRTDNALVLIEKGAEINFSDSTGDTPLMLAITQKMEECTHVLIEKGAEINASDNKGLTPLLRAVLVEDLEMLKKLIDKGANIHDSDKENWNALHFAASTGNIEIAEFLLEKGVDKNQINNSDDKPYDTAGKAGNIECFELLKTE